MQVDQEIINAQRLAANPLHSVWVAASAGSGKTKVLTDRVLNLLLSDTRPERLLCLTFTKAAAAEMSNRITDKLKSWTIAPTEELVRELTDLSGFTPSDEMIIKARQLFVAVLEAPGGMKIMTIHAFCQSVLKRFPVEANVPPQFDIIDESQTAQLMREAMDEAFLSSAFQPMIKTVCDYFSDRAIRKIFNILLEHNTRFTHLFQTVGGYQTIEKQLKKKYNLTKYHTENDIYIDFYGPSGNADCSAEDIQAAKEAYKNAVQTYLKKTATPQLRKEYVENQDPAAIKAFEATTTARLFKLVSLTGCVLYLIELMQGRYEARKRENSLMDFSDLIARTKALLTRSGMSEWVMYKMDEGIDHILVDEAQDTNPDQWEIIRLICEEFFAGLGRETRVVRTIFAVGDKKQSIYSFQGADPDEFERMHLYFKKKVQDSRHSFETVPLNASFRSVQTVLDLVNDVLHLPSAAGGVLSAGEQAEHTSVRKGEAGLIEIWPLVRVERESTDVVWPLPVKQKNTHPVTLLAQKIADKIRSFLDNRELLVSQNRPIEPKDILILVSKRSAIVSELVRALKEKNIPVAGIDRMNLNDHIAIQDLLAAARFALLADDELNLAALLKSPICGLSEEELMRLCLNRGSKTLWQVVRASKLPAAEVLTAIQNQADKVPVYEFFAYILNVLSGRKQFVSRLGAEVNETLDEFLVLTLQFEETQTPSLQNFIRWFTSRNNTVKRDMDQSAQNTVKIMTVHGSKGLQGNIVFLPDAHRLPTTDLGFLWTEEGLPLWVARTELRVEPLDSLCEVKKRLSEEEYHRLLYVALTRARDRLYICGWEKVKRVKKETADKASATAKASEKACKETMPHWYQLVRSAIGADSSESNEAVVRRDSYGATGPTGAEAVICESEAAVPTLPTALCTAAPAETPLSKPLMPSRLTENEPQTDSVVGTTQALALKRGTFIHKLLQYLPEVSPENRREVAMRLKPAEIDIPEALFAVFDDPRFQMLFGAGSVAETPVAGIVASQVVSGQIDRLVVTDQSVWIVDYKTNRHPPQTSDAVPQMYKTQLFAYKDLIQRIFPDKMVRTFLLWCETLTLMEMTDELKTYRPQFIKEKV